MKRLLSTSRAATLLALLFVVAGVMVTGRTLTPTTTAAQPAASASASGLVKVELWGEVERGGKSVALDDTQVKPGEVITWKVRVNNRGESFVSGVNAVGEIPKGTAFVPNSAGGDGITAVAYSIDGGATFSPRPMVVKDNKEVPASPDTYNAIRLTFGERIEGGTAKVAYYRTRVR